jgi:hypothetical protein
VLHKARLASASVVLGTLGDSAVGAGCVAAVLAVARMHTGRFCREDSRASSKHVAFALVPNSQAKVLGDEVINVDAGLGRAGRARALVCEVAVHLIPFLVDVHELLIAEVLHTVTGNVLAIRRLPGAVVLPSVTCMAESWRRTGDISGTLRRRR